MKNSDHNVIVTEFNLKLKETEKETLENYNLGNKECQENFKKYTTNTKMLSSIFDDKEIDIDTVTNRFLKKLDGSISQNFKKYRNKPKSTDEEQKLHEKLSLLEGKQNKESEVKKEKVLEEIAKAAEANCEKVREILKDAKNSKGGFNAKHMWKLKKKKIMSKIQRSSNCHAGQSRKSSYK